MIDERIEHVSAKGERNLGPGGVTPADSQPFSSTMVAPAPPSFCSAG